ncbi:MAG: precorrin-2 C(20)-methyltransferase [Micropruina sp.]|uniref:precorrin-2 C(20)-methyltransferase n=1 Tax=Micropruina sp. TaxID=2737536 RepID=UPI0039E255CF
MTDPAPACPPTLTGVGVGPGDPELITLKALRVLRDADVILVPDTDTGTDEVGRAEQVVLTACPEAAGRVRRVPFSMAQRHGVGTKRRRAWEASAKAAEDAFAAGAGSVAFATVGDPSVYSTFSYLAAHVRAVVPGLQVRVVPGITAMQALAAASGVPLVEAQESLTLVPVTAGLDSLAAALDSSDTVVAYKGGRHLSEVLELVRRRRPDDTAVLGVNVGLPGEELIAVSDVTADRAPYFSTLLVAPARTRTGGRL